MSIDEKHLHSSSSLPSLSHISPISYHASSRPQSSQRKSAFLQQNRAQTATSSRASFVSQRREDRLETRPKSERGIHEQHQYNDGNVQYFDVDQDTCIPYVIIGKPLSRGTAHGNKNKNKL